MHAPQIIWIIMMTLSVGLEWTNHEKPREGNHSVWVALVGTAIQVGLLWWGGFFS